MTLAAHEQNQLVIEHLDLVGQIVAEIAVRFPRHVDRSELWNAGALGLVEASRRFDPHSAIPFNRYAAIRIRGAIIDSTRTRDWATRSVRRNLRDIRQAEAGLEAIHGREPSPAELAAFLEISTEELDRRLAQSVAATLIQIDRHDQTDESSPAERLEESRVESLPEQALEMREMRGTLLEAVRNLPPAQAEVIGPYYLEGKLLQEIADDLGVTEARASQIRSEAVTAMRGFFGTQFEGVQPVDEDSPGKRARSAYLKRMATHTNWRSRLEAESSLDGSLGDEPNPED